MGSELQYDHDQVLCMTGGTGETSYATNSFLQKNVIQYVEELLKEELECVCVSQKPGGRLSVADLGCSSGPNALDFVQSVVDVVVQSFQRSNIELNAYMNDLPQNDFNTIFKLLPGFYNKIKQQKGDEVKCFVSGTPGSFYGRLFPRDFLHFVHSSYSLHWRSKVPEGLAANQIMNQGCIYARKGSSQEVLQAYDDQFNEDFSVFLKCRSEEIVRGGRMLLTMVATHDHETSLAIDSLNKALYNLAYKGRIEKEKLDAFNLSYHRPTIGQVKQVIEEEGSFTIHKFNAFPTPWKSVRPEKEEEEEEGGNFNETIKSAKYMAKTMRAVMESSLVAGFGEDVMDDISKEVEEVALDLLSTDLKAGPLNLAVSLIKM